jgi:secreted trypsin-like serine protease
MRLNNLSKISKIALVALLAAGCSGGGGGNSTSPSDLCGFIHSKTRIISGTSCVAGASSVVQLNIIESDGRAGLCSGTVISPTVVLTAAHCFAFSNVASASVEQNGKVTPVKKLIAHPNVSRLSDGTVVHDVALVILNKAVNYPSLPLVRSKDVTSGDDLFIYGYGLDENGKLGQLKGGKMTVSSTTDDLIIAIFDGSGSDTCNGDSGGPALLQVSDGTYGIVGTTSEGTSAACKAQDISSFGLVQSDANFNWIVSQVPDVGVI